MMNPFHELYVGERISSSEFVSIFSTVLVEHAAPLFLPGNVVLSGVQGSGKSMLFKLLSPEVRCEYAKAGAPFPVPERMRRFIGAGINLNTSEATHFGLRAAPEDPIQRGLLFGDFLNYVVAADLLHSIKILADSTAVAEELGIVLNDEREAILAQSLAKDDVWNGFLGQVTSLDNTRRRMLERLAHYRQFMHGNRDVLSDEISKTKTAIGDPISATAIALKRAGIVPEDVNVFVHVDQYEEIGTISTGPEGPDFQSVVNRALNKRDPSVSYRIGTRAYAWHQHATIFGTEAKLEQERDYKFVDLDEKLRRHEDPATWIFPQFARDVFARRVRPAGVAALQGEAASLTQVFGVSPTPEAKARTYGGKNPERIVNVPSNWPEDTVKVLKELAATNPLSARLGEAWILQKGFDDAVKKPPPWEEKEWWRKERVELALVQIASATRQRQLWSGEADILGLSGGNILAFLSICQQVWDLAVQLNGVNDKAPPFPIPDGIQSIGILKASENWLNKIQQEFGNSEERFKFIRYLGQRFSREMLDDRRMSYPGHNGFSVKDAELEQNVNVSKLLTEAGEFGNLVMLPHTTKERDRAPRKKWYISPIYCPVLRLPFTRTKEPEYVKAADVEGWMMEAGILKHDGRRVSKSKPVGEAPLLDFFNLE